jgi:hypothetical protein
MLRLQPKVRLLAALAHNTEYTLTEKGKTNAIKGEKYGQ